MRGRRWGWRGFGGGGGGGWGGGGGGGGGGVWGGGGVVGGIGRGGQGDLVVLAVGMERMFVAGWPIGSGRSGWERHACAWGREWRSARRCCGRCAGGWAQSGCL